MPSRISTKCEAVAPAEPYLPLTHTTDWYVLRGLMEGDANLEPLGICPVYNEPLLYFFYGRPCYRAHSSVEPNSQSGFYLISLLFDPKTVPPLKRVLPFDSGAMHIGLYKAHLHPQMKLADFEIDPDIEQIARAVNYFYGSNFNYFQERPLKDVPVTPRDLEIEAYLSIVRTKAQTPFDDRRSTFEAQIAGGVKLIHGNVLAVILPQSFLDDDVIADFIESGLGAEPIGYPCFHARPAEDVRSIIMKAEEFYRRKGYLV